MEQDVFEVEEILLGGGAAVTSGAGNPSILALDYPRGSVYLRTNGEVWQKTSLPNSGWVQLAAQSGVGNPKRIDAGSTVVVLDGDQLLIHARTFHIDGTLVLEGDADLVIIE